MSYLLVAYEVECYPIVEIAKVLESNGEKVAILRTDVWSITSNQSISDLIIKSNLKAEVFTIEQLFVDVNRKLNDTVEPDWEFLKNLKKPIVVIDP
jgi:hypothetical protein